MAKKIYLHLGLHKTATTSFQATCAKNRDSLLKQGFLYPLIDCGESNITPFENHSIPLFSLFSSKPKDYPVNQILGLNNLKEIHHHYKQQLQTALNSDQDLILSAEDITSLKTNEVRKLLSFLQKSGREVMPIAAIRHPYHYHCSQLQQQIKDGTPMVTWHHCPQRDRIKKLDDIFNEVIQFINFEESCNHTRGPVAHLMEYLGINIQNLEMTGRNIGRCNDNIRLQNALNYREPAIIHSQKNPHHVKIAPFAGQKFRLTSEELSQQSPHWDTPSEDASLIEHLEYESKLIQEITGFTWDNIKLETRKTPLDDIFPASTYALIITIGRMLQSQHHTTIRSLPVVKIYKSLTRNSSNLLRKLQPITTMHVERLIAPSLGEQPSSLQDELNECGIPQEAATALTSIASSWIRRQREEL